jgi:hypothetical protein
MKNDKASKVTYNPPICYINHYSLITIQGAADEKLL